MVPVITRAPRDRMVSVRDHDQVRVDERAGLHEEVRVEDLVKKHKRN